MPDKFLDLATLRFLLYDVHQLEAILSLPDFSEYDAESANMIIQSVVDFSQRELAPYYKEMDTDPARFENGTIRVHPAVSGYLKKCGELGLLAGPLDHDSGGMQLPFLLVTTYMYIQEISNNHMPGYAGLTFGASELLVHYASEEIKERFVPKMLTGEWGGTMCLTEPQAGSSLSDILAEAKTDGDSYLLSGQKIFISGGDYQGIENIVHLVLARIEGAPAGTKGISLFVVPKFISQPNGSLEFNDVNTIGDFQKLGQRGFCTAHLSFGDQGNCRGWLVGEPNQGLRYMFQMMNGARIATGRGAAAISMAAYQASLAYARERPQGRSLTEAGKKDASKGQTLIINHADVKRMLLRQKVIAEGGLSLILLSARYHDLSRSHQDEQKRNEYGLLLDILTPVAKTYPAEKGIDSVSAGLQVLGGYGFCEDYILQQYYRDIRIFSIYEGTTGIQSQDLLGRKITMENGRAFALLSMEIEKTIKNAEDGDLSPMGEKLAEGLATAGKVKDYLMKFADAGEYDRFLADATLVMELMGVLVVGWQWLEMGLKSQDALAGNQKYEESFYRAKLHALDYYYLYEMPAISRHAETLLNNEGITTREANSLFP